MNEITLKHGIEFFKGDLIKNPCKKCVEVDLSGLFISTVEDLLADMSTCSCDLECYCECNCDLECECYCECECVCELECTCEDTCTCYDDCECFECELSDHCGGDCQECDCGYTPEESNRIERINEMIIDSICYWSFEKSCWFLLKSEPLCRPYFEFPHDDIVDIWRALKNSGWEEIRCPDLMYINHASHKFYFSKTIR